MEVDNTSIKRSTDIIEANWDEEWEGNWDIGVSWWEYGDCMYDGV